MRRCSRCSGKVLKQEGIEFEVCQLGRRCIRRTACYHRLTTARRAAQDDDGVNEIIAKCIEADGIVPASPVYHGGIAGGMKCVLDRLILAAGCGDNQLKCTRSVRRCGTLRRSGGMETYQQLSAQSTPWRWCCHLGLLERRTRRRQGEGCAGYRGR